MGLGTGSIVLIIILALILFGPKKLPELGKAMGNTLREFKTATKGLADDEDDEKIKKQDGQ
jgi:sec-independent protein translocase protein TatA